MYSAVFEHNMNISSLYCTLYSVQCTLYSVQGTIYTRYIHVMLKYSAVHY